MHNAADAITYSTTRHDREKETTETIETGLSCAKAEEVLREALSSGWRIHWYGPSVLTLNDTSDYAPRHILRIAASRAITAPDAATVRVLDDILTSPRPQWGLDQNGAAKLSGWHRANSAATAKQLVDEGYVHAPGTFGEDAQVTLTALLALAAAGAEERGLCYRAMVYVSTYFAPSPSGTERRRWGRLHRPDAPALYADMLMKHGAEAPSLDALRREMERMHRAEQAGFLGEPFGQRVRLALWHEAETRFNAPLYG